MLTQKSLVVIVVAVVVVLLLQSASTDRSPQFNPSTAFADDRIAAAVAAAAIDSKL